MSNPVEAAFKTAVLATAKAMAKKPAGGYSTESRQVKGILINRDPPISTGWCGNDNCEHLTHKQRRSAQAAADTRSKK